MQRLVHRNGGSSKYLAIVSLAILVSIFPAIAAKVAVFDLRCDYLENPLGIDASTPRFSWKMNDPSAARGQHQTAYQILVASSPEKLRRNQGDLWDSGRVQSDASVLVPYAGKPLVSRQRCWWKVRIWDMRNAKSDWSQPGLWTMGLLLTTDWQAKWISTANGLGNKKSEPWFRKTFELAQRPLRATAYVASIGYHELYVNGRKVSDAVLTPSVVNYRKRIRYVTYDITPFVVAGKNCVGLWLGSGWSTLGEYQQTDGAMLLAQVEADLPGNRRTIVTDNSWKTHNSPLTAQGFPAAWQHGGEAYDATLDQPGWCTSDFDENGWEPVKVFPSRPQTLSAEMIEPNRPMHVLHPVSMRRTADGKLRIDMGKSFAGWLELPMRGPAGRNVTIEYSERDNQSCTYNQRDSYVCAGRAGERFQSHFNYHAFRWATITGLDEMPANADVVGRQIRTAYRAAGDFQCSSEVFNRIYQICQWTYQNLSLGGYMVDCPHRERLGYGGDAHATCETGLSQFDVGAFYTKWLMDWRDCQEPSGEFPHSAPQFGGGGGPAWGGFGVVGPWELYLRKGDRGILQTSYPSMQKWLEFLESKSQGNLLRPFTSFSMPKNPEWCFLGDWVAPGRGQGPGERVDDNTVLFFNNCYWLLNLDLAARAAEALGKNEDAVRYRKRFEEVGRVVHQQFFNAANKTYANGEQPYLVFPLMLGITPPELRPAVEQQLARTILETDKGHINSGLHGCWLLFNYLMDSDHNDLLQTIVSQQSYPGWGFMIANGATTVWEEWNGNNSRLHSTLLAVGSWFTEGIGGIRPDPAQPGYQRFIVRPATVGLQFAKASHESPYGTIRSEWRIENGKFRLDLQVPPNSRALVGIPTTDAANVREAGRPAAKSKAISYVRQENGRAWFECTAGMYSFTAD